jgi:hypothetical protein
MSIECDDYEHEWFILESFMASSTTVFVNVKCKLCGKESSGDAEVEE